jgi:tetratricopeptide (TPR) repeat protein
MNRLNTRDSGRVNPSAPEEQIEGLPESPETYWRWGLPSLVLAIITISLALVSQFYTQPRILTRYQRIVQRAMERHSASGDLPSESATPSEFRTRRDRPNDTETRGSEAFPLREIDELRNAELASQRLVVEQPTDANHRYAVARIGLMLSNGYWELARSSSRVDDQIARSSFEQLAMVARGRAEDAMRSALRYPGLGSLRAEKWILTDRLHRMSVFSHDSIALLESVIQRAEALSTQSPNDRDWLHLLGRGRVMLALSPVTEASKQERLTLLEQGERAFKQCFEMDRDTSDELKRSAFVDHVWMAEAIAATDIDQSVQWAKESVLNRIPQSSATGPIGTEGIEEIDALFRALLLMGSPEEALAAFESRRDQLNGFDRSLLQSLIASSCVRVVLLRTLLPEAIGQRTSEGRLVRLAMQLAPNSADAIALLEAWIDEKPFVGAISESESTNNEREDSALVSVFRWARQERMKEVGMGASVPSPIFPSDWTARPSDADVLVGMVPVIFEWVRRTKISPERAQEMLETMQSSAPGNANLMVANAMLAFQLRDYDRAIRELRILQERIPDNVELQNFLLAAYENAIRAKTESSKEQAQTTPAGPSSGN